MSTCLAGCYFTPDTGSGERDGGIQPPNDLFGADARTADGGGMGCASESPLVSMRVRVRTTTPNGRYSPRNIGAIWIETEQGMFVKTIERWAGTRARWLTKFNASSASNLVDAVTSATLSQHTTHDRTWNLTNLMHCEIPSGNYRVVVEMTDKNGAGPSTTIPFTMNGTPMTLTPVETTNFHDLLIELK
jgi:hypothetical protein